MSDFHGVIARTGAPVRPAQLLRDCGLSSWSFDHLVDPQNAFEQSTWAAEPSPYIDLSAGFESYIAERRNAGSKLLGQTIKKAAKIEKTLGPLRLVPHTDDESVFRALVAWKTAQYQRTEATNVFAARWTGELLKTILRRRDEAFAGMLSALYVGDQLAAVHLGMRSHGGLHCWFPAYNVEFSKYSVGLILFLELARSCESLGVSRFDLGKGDELYKREFMTGEAMVGEGSIARHPLATRLRRGWRQAREYVKTSRFAGTAKSIRNWLGPARQWMILH